MTITEVFICPCRHVLFEVQVQPEDLVDPHRPGFQRNSCLSEDSLRSDNCALRQGQHPTMRPLNAADAQKHATPSLQSMGKHDTVRLKSTPSALKSVVWCRAADAFGQILFSSSPYCQWETL